MTVSYFVRYRGTPSDPAAFDRHYASRHADILKGFPGIQSLVLHRPADWQDPCPVTPDGTHLLAQMVFASGADLDRALASEARLRARDDFIHFPPFDGEITHQALRAEIIL